jgi:hypothetical protein
MLINIGLAVWLMLIPAAQFGPAVAANSWQEPAETSAPVVEHALHPLEDVWRDLPVSARRQIDQAVLNAYPTLAEHGSSDLVLIDDEWRQTFLAAARTQLAAKSLENFAESLDSSILVWRLLGLRKAGKLPTSVSNRQYPPLTSFERLIAEIISRRAEDQFQRSLDRILVDDHGRKFFAAAVLEMAADADLSQIRRAALALRKTRQLRPELAARLVDWPVEHRSFRYAEIAADLRLVPEQPGIYLFRDETGYLYIGEAKDLRSRLTTHLTDSDREALFRYLQQPNPTQVFIDLHVFPTDSPGATLSVRRAYESELIRSRHPKFNLRP